MEAFAFDLGIIFLPMRVSQDQSSEEQHMRNAPLDRKGVLSPPFIAHASLMRFAYISDPFFLDMGGHACVPGGDCLSAGRLPALPVGPLVMGCGCYGDGRRLQTQEGLTQSPRITFGQLP